MFPPLFWFSEGPQRAGRKRSEVEEKTTGCPQSLNLPAASWGLMPNSESTPHQFMEASFGYLFREGVFLHWNSPTPSLTHTHTLFLPLTNSWLPLWLSWGRWYNTLVNTVDPGTRQPVFQSWLCHLPGVTYLANYLCLDFLVCKMRIIIVYLW